MTRVKIHKAAQFKILSLTLRVGAVYFKKKKKKKMLIYQCFSQWKVELTVKSPSFLNKIFLRINQVNNWRLIKIGTLLLQKQPSRRNKAYTKARLILTTLGLSRTIVVRLRVSDKRKIFSTTLSNPKRLHNTTSMNS